MGVTFIQKLIDQIRGKNKSKHQRRVNNAQIVHIMFNDKFNKPFVDLLNENFNNNKHLILCKKWYNSPAQEFPVGKNVIQISNFEQINFSSRKIKKIICHSLFDGELVELLYKNPKLLNKAYWIMWGGDLYKAPRDKKNDFVRKKFKGYLNDIDKKYAQDKYGMTGKFHKMFYNFPISKQMLDNAPKKNNNCVKIQVNNSCDETTLKMLDILSKFKDENIKIVTILSYGILDFKDSIIKKGQELFGEKFEYIDKLMHPEDYAKHLAQNDILILNQNRQQGVGNTLASIYLGQKVFIKKDISVNAYFNAEGIKIFDTEDIEKLDYKSFLQYNEKNNSITNVQKYFDDKYFVDLLRKVFNEK